MYIYLYSLEVSMVGWEYSLLRTSDDPCSSLTLLYTKENAQEGVGCIVYNSFVCLQLL